MIFLIVLLLLTSITYSKDSNTTLDYEAGLLWQERNAFQIPNNSNTTRIDIATIEQGPFWVNRVYLSHQIKENREVRLLLAPLTLNLDTILNSDLAFQNHTFLKGEAVKITYKFNSYRLSYIYKFKTSESFSWRAGLTIKVRDAKIAVNNSVITQGKDDLGFVPLLNFGLRYYPSSSKTISVDLDADALVGPQGRAEDLAMKLNYAIYHSTELYLGARVLEGGADNKKVYTFSLFYYAIAGIKLSF